MLNDEFIESLRANAHPIYAAVQTLDDPTQPSKAA
jgi:hypothetical protein